MGRTHSLTREQIQGRKDRAVRFTRDVVGDPDRADEIEGESLESYAQRRKLKLENPNLDKQAVVVRKRGKLWAAYPTKEDAILQRNEVAAASTKEKLRAFLNQRNPARLVALGAAEADDTITRAVEILEAAYVPSVTRADLVEAIRGALAILTG